MDTTSSPPCLACQKLQALIEALQAQVADLQQQIARLRKDSSTSSKPPSSDIVKPPRPVPPGQDKRKRGGQPGHPRHQRTPLPPELLSEPPREYRLDRCPDCQANLHPADIDPRVLQQIDLPDSPSLAVEHRCLAGYCPCCSKVHFAPLPAEVQAAGLVGPRLTTLIAYLKGACHASYSTIRKFLRDVAGVTISRGELARVITRVSAALEPSYEELLAALPGQGVLNVDETGHKRGGQRMWTWCFRASLFTLFKIDPRRSSEVLIGVLGEEFDGVLGCDYFSAYRKFMRRFDVVLQFCLAHLIRDVKYLTTLADARDRAYGKALLEALRELFGVIHRRAELPEAEFDRRLGVARDDVLSFAGVGRVTGPASGVIAKRLDRHGEEYFTFLTTPGMEPTNNLAEQAIRFVVLDRVVTQGTRGEKGDRWCERIWTTIATCAQQGRSVFEYLHACVVSHFDGRATPSLAPAGA